MIFLFLVMILSKVNLNIIEIKSTESFMNQIYTAELNSKNSVKIDLSLELIHKNYEISESEFNLSPIKLPFFSTLTLKNISLFSKTLSTIEIKSYSISFKINNNCTIILKNISFTGNAVLKNIALKSFLEVLLKSSLIIEFCTFKKINGYESLINTQTESIIYLKNSTIRDLDKKIGIFSESSVNFFNFSIENHNFVKEEVIKIIKPIKFFISFFYVKNSIISQLINCGEYLNSLIINKMEINNLSSNSENKLPLFFFQLNNKVQIENSRFLNFLKVNLWVNFISYFQKIDLIKCYFYKINTTNTLIKSIRTIVLLKTNFTEIIGENSLIKIEKNQIINISFCFANDLKNNGKGAIYLSENSKLFIKNISFILINSIKLGGLYFADFNNTISIM